MNCSKRVFLAGIDGVSMWSAIVSGGPSPRTVSKRVFVRHFRLKTITLPRQARDKHGESSKQRRVFLQEIAHTITNSWNVVNGVKPCNACVGSEKPGKGTRLFAPFLYKIIILPRQARDKHRESTQKRTRFCRQNLHKRLGGRALRAKGPWWGGVQRLRRSVAGRPPQATGGLPWRHDAVSENVFLIPAFCVYK